MTEVEDVIGMLHSDEPADAVRNPRICGGEALRVKNAAALRKKPELGQVCATWWVTPQCESHNRYNATSVMDVINRKRDLSQKK